MPTNEAGIQKGTFETKLIYPFILKLCTATAITMKKNKRLRKCLCARACVHAHT